jgi:hypothetical protein
MDLPISFSHMRITTWFELHARAVTGADELTQSSASTVRSQHDAVVELSEFRLGREKTEALSFFLFKAISASRTYCSIKSSEPE